MGFLPQEVRNFSEGDGDELNFEEQAASGEEPSRKEEHCRHNARCWEASEKELNPILNIGNIEPKRVTSVQ